MTESWPDGVQAALRVSQGSLLAWSEGSMTGLAVGVAIALTGAGK
jgi:hypothetical protein